MLEYDNSAFYYFAITLLAIYLLPGTWYAVSELISAVLGSGDVGTKPRTKSEREKAEQLKAKTTGWARLNTTTYKTNLACLIVAWVIFLYLISLVSNDGEVRAFDPFQILGIDHEAELNVIKKAYRRLSLQYHPDKNPGNKAAEEMFMKIKRAYEALTDETSKKNYEEFGNPDGKQSLEVSIGLPKLLLDNPKVVLVCYLIGMVVIIPAVVGYWYSNSKQFGEKNILYESYRAFYTLLQPEMRAAHLPEILSASAEFRAINDVTVTAKKLSAQQQREDEQALNAIWKEVSANKNIPKPKFETPNILRGNLLLHAHLLRLHHLLTPTLKADLDAMLSRAPELIDGLIEIAQQKKWIDSSAQVLKLSQCLAQAIDSSADSLTQLPHITEKEVKAVKNNSKIKVLGDLLAMDSKDQEKTLRAAISNGEFQNEIMETLKLMPQMSLDVKIFVEEEDDDDFDDDEQEAVEETKPELTKQQQLSKSGQAILGDQIYEGDLVTVRITLKRKFGDINSPVYAPFFPRTLYDHWWILLTDAPPAGGNRPEVNIHAFEKIVVDTSASKASKKKSSKTSNNEQIVHEVRFLAPPRAGEYAMELQLMNDSYSGIDLKYPFVFTVLPAADLPEYAPHPEDVELDNEPTLFEQVMAANVDDDSSDEEDDDEDEDESEAKPTKQQQPTKAITKGVVVEDDDSDDE